MSTVNKEKEELLETVQGYLPDPIIVIGYLEHQIDLLSEIVVDLAESSTLAPETQVLLGHLKDMLAFSSVNFIDLDNPMEAYKIPTAIGLKKNIRSVQVRFLMAQMRKGLFGK